MKPIYKFSFPFTGKVKTQLVIAKNRLVKPKSVKHFEDQVRLVLAHHFPIGLRPIKGYLKVDMYHFTEFKEDKNGVLCPTVKGDLDNLYKALVDCFQPVTKKMTVFGQDGKAVLTEKGNVKYTHQKIVEGVIENDKYIVEGSQRWVPVEIKSEERIEVYITVLSKEELFSPILPDGRIMEI